MIKSIKKVLFIITTTLLAIALTACSSAKQLSTQEVVDKYVDAAKNIKNTKFTSDLTMKITSGSQSHEMKMSMNGSTSVEPLTGLFDVTVKAGATEQKISMYFKDTDVYVKTSDNAKWTKTPTNSSMKKQLESLKTIGGTEAILDFYKNNANDFKVEEKGDNYEITYSGNGEKFKELMKQTLSAQGQDASSLGEVNLNNVVIKIIVKKSDFTPISTDSTIEVSDKNNDNNKLNMDIKYTFSDTNSTTVNAPDGI